MKDLYVQLSENLGAMTEAQKSKFYAKRVSGSPIESQVSLTETVLKESGHNIRRNNGQSRQSTDADRKADMMAEADSLLFSGMAAARSTAKGIENLVEVNGNYVDKTSGADQLTESERADVAFCQGIGLSLSESLKVVKSKGGLRG